jgi:hypothetical protein
MLESLFANDVPCFQWSTPDSMHKRVLSCLKSIIYMKDINFKKLRFRGFFDISVNDKMACCIFFNDILSFSMVREPMTSLGKNELCSISLGSFHTCYSAP